MKLLLLIPAAVVLVYVLARLWPSSPGWIQVVRHTPIAVFGLVRWRGLAAHIGLGRMVPSSRSGRRHPVETPWVSRWHPTATGYQFRVWLRRGDALVDLAARIPELSIGLRGTVRLRSIPGKPWRVSVSVQRTDPFLARVPSPKAISPTLLQVGVTEVDTPFILDFARDPHMLTAGSTGAGKSSGNAAIIAALCPTDAVIAMVDCKHAVSAEPMRPRASWICETRDEASQLFEDLLALGKARSVLLKAECVDTVYDLAAPVREVYVFVDEISELSTGSTKDEKDASALAISRLLRSVQLLRSFGVHVIVSGQRVGSSMGPRITDIRAQLSGRLCYHMADVESANMCIGDVASEAAFAALEIAPASPGVAVSNTGPDRWQLIRMAHVPHKRLAEIAAATADKRVTWSQLMAETVITSPLTAVNDTPERVITSGEAAA